MNHRIWNALLLFAVAVLGAGRAEAFSLNLEVRQLIPGNPFGRHVYVGVQDITEAQYAAVVAPAGFEKAAPRVQLFTSASVVLPMPPAGVSPALDLVPDVPGADFNYVAQVLSGSLLAFDPQFGLLTLAQVQRSTVLHYEAGQVVHEVIDSSQSRYILFTFDLAATQTYDLTQLGALSALALPSGWSYTSRVLAQDLDVDSNGLATVFGQGGIATYQRFVVPEPSTMTLLACGLAGLGALRRLRH